MTAPVSMDGTRVLVTGASGFIGAHLTRRLVREGADVHGMTSTVSSIYPDRLRDVRADLQLHEANLMDRTAMEKLVHQVRPEVVLHLGAYTHVGKSWNRVDECVQANIQGTVNLLEALADTDYRRFVNVGTSEIYGAIDVPFREDACPKPVSPYAVSKYSAEMYCRLGAASYGWPIVMVRPFNAYGPGQSPDRIVPEVILRGLRGDPLPMTAGTQTREFNYVEDIAEGLVAAATAPDVDGELLNIGCGQEVAIRDLAVRILDVMGNPVAPEFGALPDRPIEIWRMYCDNTRARELLGWRPRHSLEDGLAATIDWYRAELADRPDSPFIPGFARGT